MLSFLHTLSGVLIFAFLGGKIVLHYRLNILHNRNPGLKSFIFTPLDYFLPYDLKVTQQYVAMKKTCNRLLWGMLWALTLNILFGLLEFSHK